MVEKITHKILIILQNEKTSRGHNMIETVWRKEKKSEDANFKWRCSQGTLKIPFL